MPDSQDLISVILPTYNEAGNITALINEIKKYLKKWHYEILVIDDDSPDDTGRFVKKKFGKNKKIRLYIRKKDKGLSYAIRFGIEKAEGNLIIVMDTDFNHNPKDLPRLINATYNFDLVTGSRYIKGGGMENRMRYVLSYVYNMIIRFILRLETYDNLSGFFIIKKKVLIKFNFDQIFYGYGDYFIRLLHQAQKNKLAIHEIPVFYKNRISGLSKSRFFSMFIQYSKTVADLLIQK